MVTKTPIPARADIAATVQKAARQPRCWPIIVPADRPSTVATVSPPASTLIALARALTGTRPIAVLAATAQKPAYTKAPATRVANSTP